ncbi:glutathione S-transferase family protein [Rhodoligotrophos defluvii]|uniref:glutathione S-transferase family protein n=1 Tax=Rhodoligotrophos defluvii TaxID=2561934 RepID=UPI0010C9AFA5|nr:glutathione S-transferase family protein [Rhodoligotrophos defluvii]
MKLIYAPQSPFARKVRAAAIELGLADRFELEFVQLTPGQKNRDYASSVNPLRKLPALVLDDGQTIVDSTVICEYLDALAGGGKLVPVSGPERWRILTQHAVAQGMMDAMILVRYETWLRPEPHRWAEWIDDQWDKALSGLAWFESRAEIALRQGGGRIDLSQLALACGLGYLDFRFPETGWRERFPKLAAWYGVVLNRPSLAQTKPETPPAR